MLLGRNLDSTIGGGIFVMSLMSAVTFSSSVNLTFAAHPQRRMILIPISASGMFTRSASPYPTLYPRPRISSRGFCLLSGCPCN